MAFLVLRGLTKRFGEVGAVESVDLTVARGEFVSLLGPSGCGKTTTLRLLAGFLRPDAGEIRLEGQVVSSPARALPPERRNMSMIFQSYAIWPHMTVFGNVAYGLRQRGLGRQEIAERVRRMLGVVRLDGLEGRYPAELSGGQQQRVALARALVVEPLILLLDEPLSNLDANLREEMRFEIRRLHDRFRITTVYVTHDQAEAMVNSDRIVVMDRGRIAQIGTPEQVYEAPRTEFVARFIGKTNLLDGTLGARGLVALGAGTSLHLADAGEAAPAGRVKVCIRPHDVSILASRADPPDGDTNYLDGRIERHVYLGEARDYLVRLEEGGIAVRVVTGPGQRHAVGDRVVLAVARSACRLVAPAEGRSPTTADGTGPPVATRG